MLGLVGGGPYDASCPAYCAGWTHVAVCLVHSGRERGNAPTAPTSSGMEAAVMSPGSVVSSVSMAPSRPRSSALDSSPDFSSLVSVSPFCACVRENCDVRAGEKG